MNFARYFGRNKLHCFTCNKEMTSDDMNMFPYEFGVHWKPFKDSRGHNICLSCILDEEVLNETLEYIRYVFT